MVFGLRVSAAVVAYVTHIILARLLEPSEFGALVFAQALLWIATMLSTFGLASTGVRVIPDAIASAKKSYVTGYVRHTRRITVSIGVLLTSVATAVWCFSDFDATRLAVLRTLAVAIPFNTFLVVNSVIARGFGWYVFATIWSNALRPLLYLAAIVVLFYGLSLRSSATWVAALLVGVIVVVAMLQYVVLRSRMRTQNLPAEGRHDLKAWITMGLVIMVSDMYSNYYIDLHVVVGGLFLSSEEMAIQNAVLRTLGVVGFAATAVNFVAAPKIAAFYAAADMRSLSRLARRAVGAVLLVTLFGVSFVLLFGESVLALFGELYVTGFSSMCVAAIAQVISILAVSTTPLLTMTGAHRALIPGVLLALGVEVIATYLLAPKFGILGSSAAIVLASITWCAWNLYSLGSHFASEKARQTSG